MNEDLISDRNPAMKLFEVLSMWSVTPAGESAYVQRGGEMSFWEATSEAIRWCDLTVAEIARQSQTDPTVAEDMMPILQQCRRAIFALDNNLSSALNQSRIHIEASALSMLRTFSRTWRPVLLDREAGLEVLDLVRRLRDLVNASEALGPDVRDYIVRLTMNIEATLLAKSIWDTVDLQDQTLQLAAAVQAFVLDGDDVEEETKTEARPFLKRLQNRLSTLYWADIAPKMVGAGWTAVQKALES